MLWEITFFIVAFLVAGHVVEYVLSCRDDPREPPRVKSAIPLIGHLLGFLWYGYDYYIFTNRKSNSDIYTIGILHLKIYVTNGQRLVPAIQKSRTLTIGPIFRQLNKANADVSDEWNALYTDEVIDKVNLSARNALAPGPQLDEQNLRMGNEALNQVTGLAQSPGRVNLYSWIRHAIVQATATGLYGAKHPYRDTEVEKALWAWEYYKGAHVIGINPLNRGPQAREKIFNAFRKYFASMPEDVSHIVKERQKILLETGLPQDEISRMQSTLNDAAYPNTVPTLFWFLFEIFSRPSLLEAVRQELSDYALEKQGATWVLNVSAIKKNCHVLVSTFQEVQRTRHAQVTFRLVSENTELDGGAYLLKKGGTLNMPAKPTHLSTAVWGHNAAEFVPDRFVPHIAESKSMPGNLMPWGSAPHICPGRQFVSTEMLLLTALVCLKVDLIPKNNVWRAPKLAWLEILSILRPRHDIGVEVVPREGMMGDWALALGNSTTRVPLISG